MIARRSIWQPRCGPGIDLRPRHARNQCRFHAALLRLDDVIARSSFNRHFGQLSNIEAAQALGLAGGCGMRHLHFLRRLGGHGRDQ